MAAPSSISDNPAAQNNGELARFLKVDDPPQRRGLACLALNPILSRHILRVALPVVLGMVTQTAINILDSVMVGYLPKAQANPGQAAIGLSLPFMWMVGGFLSAVWVGTQALVSRRAGEGDDALAGRVLTNSLIIAVASSVVLSMVAILVTPSVVSALYSDPVVVENGVDYLQARYVGVLAMVATFSFKSFFDGTGRTYVFMAAAIVMNLLNVLLNLLLIFGFEPLAIPRMGVTGAAWASVISAYVGLLILVVWSFKPAYRIRYGYYKLKNINRRVIAEILRLSLPNGGATIVVMLGFSAFYWVGGQVNDMIATPGNPFVFTANQNVVVAIMPSFMTSLAFGSATAAVVGQALGAGRPYLAERYGWEAVKLWAYVMWLFGLVLLLFPSTILGLINPDPQVIAAGEIPLRMMAIPHGIIAIAVILAQTLYGVGNAKFVMVVELLLHLLVMAPSAYLFGVVLGLGLPGVFLGPMIYMVLLASIMFVKFRRNTWKEIVI